MVTFDRALIGIKVGRAYTRLAWKGLTDMNGEPYQVDLKDGLTTLMAVDLLADDWYEVMKQ